MNSTLKTLALGLVLAASLHPAMAASIHTYVSAAGNNGNVCSRSAPCQTFSGALANTSPGGVITALDAANYGTVNIAQAVTIDGTGTQASIVKNSGVYAITINAASGDMVILRHLTLLSLPGTTFSSGITLNTGNLTVDDCKISGYDGRGIDIFGGSSAVVENTAITGCGVGISTTSQGLVTARNDVFQGNVIGFAAQAGQSDVSHSLITQNTSDGLYAGSSTLSVLSCIVTGNGTAVFANSSLTIRLSDNDIFNNTVGIDTTSGGGLVSTAGNNRKGGNPTPGAPTPGKVIVVQ